MHSRFGFREIALLMAMAAILVLLPQPCLATNQAPPPKGAFGLEGYRVASMVDDARGDLKYTDASGTERSIGWYGAKWDLRAKVADKTEARATGEKIVAGVTGMRGEILFRDADGFVARVAGGGDPGRLIYLEGRTNSARELRLEIILERMLAPDRAVDLVFDPARPDFARELVYRADFDGSHYYTLEIEILEGQGVKVEAKSDVEDAAIRIRHKAVMYAEAKYYKKYGMYDLDPYRGPHIFNVQPVKPKEKTRVRLTLRKCGFPVTPLGELSAKPGVFRLKNALSDLPELEPLGNISGGYEPIGDVLPDGDAIYWLSNGYYSFVINGMRTNLTPVLASHQTTVEWPLTLAELKPPKSGRKSGAGRMAVYGGTPLSADRASVDISLGNLAKGLEPVKEDFAVFEAGGIAGRVESVERLPEPMNLVILLDSSGSMKRSMKQALDSVEDFINLLPADAEITLVDFDTKVKPIRAAGRAELIKKLRQIRADGATALYDAVITAQTLLAGKSRASVVLFTDGRDANYNDTARGSKATFKQMMKSVQGSNLPIYPIAFGAKADTATLQAIAKLTKTTYYQGESRDALADIFAAIAGDLSSAFRVTYLRGKRPANGSQPVVNFMADVSGSMDLRFTMNKDCEGCGYRLEQLKEMLAKSALALDDDTFIQLSTFSKDVNTLQVITRDKAKVLAGIGAIKVGGGTDIVEAVARSLDLCQVIPSDRRYLVFVTDAAGDAFEFDEDRQKRLNADLMALNEAGVQCFWLGMWESPKVVKALGELAQLSGGESFVSSDVNAIRDKVLELTARIKADQGGKAAAGNTVEVRFSHRDVKTGALCAAVGRKLVDMPVPVSAEKAEVSDIGCVIKPMDVDRQSYNQAAAASIYGDDMPLKEVRVRKIIPLVDRGDKPVSAANRAMRLDVSRAVLLDRLKGISPGSKKQFLVLDMEMANIMPSQEVVVLEDGANHPSAWVKADKGRQKTIQAIPTYLIPGLRGHLFIRVNNGNEVAFHPITWALEEPLSEIDSASLAIPGGGRVKGVLAFLVPEESITELSLHYYDTAYGHIDLPLIGTMTHGHRELADLPKQAPAKLSEAFELRVAKRGFASELAGIAAPEGSVFEVLGLELDSRVNALLKLNPGERFSLRIRTDQGEWAIPPNGLTARVPMGLEDGVSLAPGSHNRFDLVFQVPEALKDAPQELMVEQKGEDKRIAVGDAPGPGGAPGKGLARGHAQGIELTINSVAKVDKLDGRNKKRLLVDVTLDDAGDGQATRLREFLAISNAPKQNFLGRSIERGGKDLNSKGLGGFSNAKADTDGTRKFSFPDAESQARLLSCSRPVDDGTKVRCVALFDADKMAAKGDIYLISPVFPDIVHKFNPARLPKLEAADAYKLTRALDIKAEAPDKRLKELLAKARQEKSNRARLGGAAAKKALTLDDDKPLARDVDPLPVSYAGGLVVANIKDTDAAVKALAGLRWVPAFHERPMYSAQAMFTQGWGTEYDMLAFLAAMLRRDNTEVELGSHALSPAGEMELAARAGAFPLVHRRAIYLKWSRDGQSGDIVLPFLKPAAELADLLVLGQAKAMPEPKGLEAGVELTLYYEDAASGGAGQIGSMGSALSGGSGGREKKLKLLHRRFAMPEASNMPLDFWFAVGKNDKGDDVLRTYVSGPGGVEDSDARLKGGIVPKKLVVGLGDGNGDLEPLVLRFKDGQGVADVFLTIGFALPDLPENAVAPLREAQQRRLANVAELSDFSHLQWLNRAKIYSFVAMQSRAEAARAAELMVGAARRKTPRVIAALVERTPGGGVVSSLDLRSVAADVYGPDLPVAAFKAGGGIFDAQAEAAVTPGAGSMMDQWFKVEDQKIAIIMPGGDKDMVKALRESGADNWTLARLKNSDKVWFYPLKNDGKPIWLEVDPFTYETVAVLPSGMHGATAENRIIDTLIREGAQYAAGFFAGTELSVLILAHVCLDIQNYDKALERAETIAGLVACGVGTLSSMANLKGPMTYAQLGSTTADIGLGIGSCFNGDAARVAGVAKGVSFSMAGGDFKGDGVKSVLGFANGFGDAVTLFFKKAKASANRH